MCEICNQQHALRVQEEVGVVFALSGGFINNVRPLDLKYRPMHVRSPFWRGIDDGISGRPITRDIGLPRHDKYLEDCQC